MSANHTICALAYEGLCTFEFAIAVEAFGLPRPEINGTAWYDFKVAAINDKPFNAMGGITVTAQYGLDELVKADTVIIPGWQDINIAPPESLIDALKTAWDNNARIVTICSGVFVLAHTGLLDGKTATTHWRYAEQLASQFPKINVDAGVLYVDEGRIITSAGSAAGLDMCIHIIRHDYGAKIANQVARRFVLPAHREGGQAQFIPKPVAQEHNNLSPILDELRQRLDEPFSIPQIADMAGMSIRTLIRHFKKSTGMSPIQWLTTSRIQLARELLETTDHSIDQIAQTSGFATSVTMRHHFRKLTGTSPMQYRQSFRQK